MKIAMETQVQPSTGQSALTHLRSATLILCGALMLAGCLSLCTGAQAAPPDYLKLLARAGIEPIVITGRDSPAVRRRVADLGLRHAIYGVSDKLAAAEPLLEQLGLSWPQVAAIGDDWPDLPLLTRAGFACAPANAHAEVQAVAHHVTTRGGGDGAAREFCDLLLMAAGRYAELLRSHLHTLDGR